MTLVDEDIAAARRAAQAVERAVQSLVRHYGDTVDRRRLLADVGRLSPDLDLLCGTAPAQAPAPAPQSATPSPPPPREVIPDTPYDRDFWMDAEDEGLGRYDTRSRGR
jgi:hypothetical protein